MKDRSATEIDWRRTKKGFKLIKDFPRKHPRYLWCPKRIHLHLENRDKNFKFGNFSSSFFYLFRLFGSINHFKCTALQKKSQATGRGESETESGADKRRKIIIKIEVEGKTIREKNTKLNMKMITRRRQPDDVSRVEFSVLFLAFLSLHHHLQKPKKCAQIA